MNTGLVLVKKAPQAVGLRECAGVLAAGELGELREGSTGRVVTMLPRVWAVAETAVVQEMSAAAMPAPQLVTGRQVAGLLVTRLMAGAVQPVAPPAQAAGAGAVAPGSRPKVELAFYRKYTEGMLRRYLRMSTEAGRVPSLLGRELFRGNVTSYKVHSFEDVVVFCMDVERCLGKLDAEEKELIRRVTLQEYTQAEAAAVMGMSLRSLATRYGMALDRLTGMLLKARLLEPLKSCQ